MRLQSKIGNFIGKQLYIAARSNCLGYVELRFTTGSRSVCSEQWFRQYHLFCETRRRPSRERSSSAPNPAKVTPIPINWLNKVCSLHQFQGSWRCLMNARMKWSAIPSLDSHQSVTSTKMWLERFNIRKVEPTWSTNRGQKSKRRIEWR